jgi:peroxiredoxin
MILDVPLLVVRLVLAAVFVVSGVAKLVDRDGSRQALRDFGLPAVLTSPLGIALPVGELVIALALLPAVSAWGASVAALGLFSVFVVGIAVNLARGRTPDCRCFGQLHSGPIGSATIARDGVLTMLAGFVVWQGRGDVGPSAVAWVGDLTVAQAGELIVGILVLGLIVAEGWFLVHLLAQQGRLLLRIDALEARLGAEAPTPDSRQAPSIPGLPVGVSAPIFQIPRLGGEMLSLETLRSAGKPILLLFSDPGCGPCNSLLPEVGRWQRDHANSLTLAVISRGSAETNRAKAAEHDLTHVLLQRDREVAESYRAYGTPSAVLVGSDGLIRSVLAQGADGIRALVAQTAGVPPALPLVPSTLPGVQNGNAHHAAIIPPKVGDPAPAIALPGLDGQVMRLADFRGKETLVLFWNPGCGFCQQMLGDLLAWEAQPPRGAPRLLIVSTGTVEGNRAMGLRSPIVLEPGFVNGYAFGATGTPSAVLVDSQGKVASPVAVGARAVLSLARNSDGVVTAAPV